VSRRLVILAAVAGALVAPATAAAGTKVPATEVTSITPTGKHSATVIVKTPGDLSASGVQVMLGDTPALVDGVRRHGRYRPLHLVFAIDTSGSMRGAPIAAAIEAGQRLLDSVRSKDRVALITFDDDVEVLAALTADVDGVRRALAGLGTANGTSLYDGVAQAIKTVGSDQNARRVVVVLSDGADTKSERGFAAVRRLAAGSGAEVDVVGLTSSASYTDAPLRELASSASGRLVQTADVEGLKPITMRLTQETLATPYEVQVSLPEGDASKLTVSVRGAPETNVALPAGVRGRTPSPWQLYGPWAIGFLAFAAVAIALLGNRSTRRPASLATRLEPYGASQAKALRRSQSPLVLENLYEDLEKLVGRTWAWDRLERSAGHAGLVAPVGQVVLVIAGAAVAGLVLGFAVVGLLGVVPGAAAGALAPVLTLRFLASRRQNRFEAQLPELLSVLSSALRAGRSFAQALDAVVDEAAEPALGEFRRVQNQVRLGVPIEQALEEMSQRLHSESFELVVLTTDVQRRIGGNVAEVFDQVAETVRKRQQFAARVKALTAMGSMSAYVLLAMPFGLAGLITLINHDYMAPLFTTSAGHFLMGVGFVSMTIGGLVLRRMVKPRATA
jgi:tight adherence protein B